jgi:hypothetical protein
MTKISTTIMIQDNVAGWFVLIVAVAHWGPCTGKWFYKKKLPPSQGKLLNAK